MNKRKIKEIVKFSLQKRIRNKWFVLLNLIILISTVAACNIGNIKTFLKNNNINLFQDEMTIEISDDANLAKDLIEQKFKDSENVKIIDKTGNEYSEEIPKNYIYIELSESEEYVIDIKIVSNEGLPDDIYSKIELALKDARSRQFANVYNIELSRLEILNKDLNIERVMLGVNEDNSDVKQMIKTISTFIIYFISIFILASIANEIAQEKVSKSIEYVLTSISAKEYLLAKIISVIGFIVIQGIYIFIYYMIGNLINTLINMNGAAETATVNLMSLTSNINQEILLYLATVVTYGILTLILMTIIQAALSSKTTSMSESGNSISFLMSITITMYFITLFVITPYTQMSPVLYIISCIPLISNYFVPAIMIIGQANAIQIAVSLIVLVVSIPVTFSICAKVFKNGVLDYKPNNKKAKKDMKAVKSIEELEEEKVVKENSKKYAFVVGMGIILWLTCQVIGSLVGGTILNIVFKDLLNPNQISFVTLGITSIISLIVPIIFVSMYVEDENKVKDKKIPILSLAKVVLIGMAFVGIIQIALRFIYPIIGIEYNVINVLTFNKEDGVLSSILYIICIAVIPAVFEELFFRKILIDHSRKIGKVFAIFASSLIFGVIHLNLGQGIFAFILGIILGIIYTKTGSIKTTMTIHFLNNFFATLLVLFTEAEGLLNIIAISVIVFGLLIMVITIAKNRKNIHLIEFDRLNLNKYKYLFFDYTFLITVFITGLLLTATENILKM